MATNPNYTIPGVSGTVTAVPQTAPVAPGVRMGALVGTAGQGPDVPTVFTNLAAAYAAYGSFGASGTLPGGFQAAMSAPAGAGVASAPVIGYRVGVTRASATIYDAGTTPAALTIYDSGGVLAANAVATLYGIGSYAGSAGNGATGLRVQVAAGTSSGYKVIISINSVATYTYDNLPAGGASLQAAILADAAASLAIFVIVGPSTNIATVLAATNLTGGTGSQTAVATIQAIGQYAGTAGNALTAAVASGTTSGFKVTIKKGSTVLSTYDNLANGAALYGAAHGDPNIAVNAGASANLAYSPVAGAFSGGADGLASAGSAVTTAVLANLFSGATVPPPRYLSVLWDASTVYANVAAALNTAATDTSHPAVCLAFLGGSIAGASNTMTALATLAQTISNGAVALWGMPSGVQFNPNTGVPGAFDGYYVAASLMGLKAALPVQTSLIGISLAPWTGNGNVTISSVTRQPTLADTVTYALGASGCAYGLSGARYSGLQVIDSLTTAAQTGASAYAAQPAMQDGLYHAMTTAWAAGAGIAGAPAQPNGGNAGFITHTIQGALQGIAGGAINSVNSVITNPDPTTLGRYLPQVSINLSPTVRNIVFGFQVSATN